MKRFLPLAVLLLVVGAAVVGQPRYRTFSQSALALKKTNVGRPLGSLVTFTFVNDTALRGGVHGTISSQIRVIVDSGGFKTIDLDGAGRLFSAYGKLLNRGDTARLTFRVDNKMAGTHIVLWWLTDTLGQRRSVTHGLVAAETDIQMYVQPNGGNVRDYIYKKVIQRPQGVVAGIPRPDAATQFGWIRFKTSDRLVFPQRGPARCFDYLVRPSGTQKPFLGEIKNPHVQKYDNHLLGEVHALKLAIIANDAGVTEPVEPGTNRLGDLLYTDTDNPTNPRNGMTLRELVHLADSALTYCGTMTSDEYAALDSCVSQVNEAFDGSYFAISFNPFLLAGVRSPSEIQFLQLNPNAQPVVTPEVSASILDEYPEVFELRSNYPNPFNPSTTIEFRVGDEPSIVTLKVYNQLGQEVATLLNEEELEGGEQSVTFDANGLSSGVYLYRITARGLGEEYSFWQSTKSMLLLK
jgi:hypothetical protein